MRASFDPSDALEAVRRLCDAGIAATADSIAAFLLRLELCADLESVRAVLEDLAASGELARIQSAAHTKGQPLEWTTSYFPTAER